MQTTTTRRSVRITVAAWILILVLTGAFQFYRAAISDGIVFLALAVALIAGETGILRRLDRRSWQPRRAVVVIALAIAAAVLVLMPRHGIADGVVLVTSGILVLVVVWPNSQTVDTETTDPKDTAWTARLKRSAVAWAILGIAFCLWELTMYFLGLGATGRLEYPALSDILDPLLNNPIGRLVFVAAWLTGGVGLARRGRTAG